MNPIKFLDAYNKNDRAIFFGRDEEIDELYKKVISQRVVVLYGLSGTGKTSLIQCGLCNKFSEFDWFDIIIRRGHDINISTKRAISDVRQGEIKRRFSISESLEVIYLELFKPIYLIFDQFEELFISGSLQEQLVFSKNVKEILHNNLNVKLIFVLREEYLGSLDILSKEVKDFSSGRAKMRLEKMGKTKVNDVIINILNKSELQDRFDEEDSNHISAILADHQGFVNLPYLQVYLERLISKAALISSERTKSLIHSTQFADVLDIFLMEQVKKVGNIIGDEVYVWNLLKRSFITPEGTKKLFYPKDHCPDG